MVDIQYYMNDGACWQAQAVLAYLKGNLFRITEDLYAGKAIRVEVGRYENCREQGYVVSLNFFGYDSEAGRPRMHQRNYAIYEHRNTDTICVLISNVLTQNTPGISEMWRDKGENPRSCDYDAGFECGDIKGCANYILADMVMYLEENIKKEE